MKVKNLLALCALTLAASYPLGAHAHARLEASDPKAGSIVATAPKQLRLQFSDIVELAFSKVKLLDKANTSILPLKLDLDKSNPKTIVASLPPLKSGPYRVQWTALTRDGHKVKGEFAFQVK
ncbi:MAG TPA: copper resistance CopC family protein [Telluria sp.]|nr:copper resistance CopC family protein [Telluria sp.]